MLTRKELIEESGLGQVRCRGCGKQFWSDWQARCETCRRRPADDDDCDFNPENWERLMERMARVFERMQREGR